MSIPWTIDRKVRLPRVWSNRQLAKFAGMFAGQVVNVSAWQDEDKEGRRYRSYFSGADGYSITNYVAEAKGFQEGLENQIFLDLEGDVSENLKGAFDVVFNHTVLEHVFECQRAFANLCAMSSDVVIIVVPFLQHQHSSYGDYWRFTPNGVKRLYEKNGLELLYINFNDGPNQAVYIFAVGSKRPQNWSRIRQDPDNRLVRLKEGAGGRLVRENPLHRLARLPLLLSSRG